MNLLKTKHSLIFLSLFFYGLFFYACFSLAKLIISFSVQELSFQNIQVLTLSATESFIMLIQFSVILSILILLPLLIPLIYYLVRDALYYQERSFFAKLFILPILWLFGSFIAFYITLYIFVPFFYSFNIGLNVENTISLSNLILMLSQNILIFILIFSTPVVIRTLVHTNLLSVTYLRSKIKHFSVLSLFLAMILTPPDLLSMLIVSIFLILLYVISLY